MDVVMNGFSREHLLVQMFPIPYNEADPHHQIKKKSFLLLV